MTTPAALAIFAHPDDIEFVAAEKKMAGPVPSRWQVEDWFRRAAGRSRSWWTASALTRSPFALQCVTWKRH
jgi:hypothetical protein